MRTLPALFVIACVGCAGEDPIDTQSQAQDQEQVQADRHHGRDPLYRDDAEPFGRSVERWSEKAWDYVYSLPFDTNPFFDTTGEHCADGQHGPVWFLPSVPGASLGNVVTRSCAIPKDKAIMLQLASVINDYPCPDPTFQPAPGQKLYDFLIEPLLQIIDGFPSDAFAVTLDGEAIPDVLSHRFTSPNIFHFTGDPSMAQFDGCVSGQRQDGVTDGFYLMFKPLDPGHHQIVVVGHDGAGDEITLTENLFVR